MSTRTPKLISIVAPCYNESAVLPHLRRELAALADRLAPRFAVEILLVDDGSHDDTWQQILAFAASDTRVRGLALARNFGHQAALSCAYDAARGDAVVSIDADLQDPLSVIDAMLERWEAGADVVFAVRQQRDGETMFKRATAAFFYRLMRAMGARHLRQDAGDFRLMSRKAVEALQGMKEYHRFIRGMVGWIGFRTAEVHYRRAARRAGATKYPLRRMLRFAFDAMISFSFAPLRLAYLAAILISAGIFGYLGLVLVRYVFFAEPLVPGWTSLILSIAGFGTANLVCLGIMGEYVGRTFEQGKGRPVYIVNHAAGSDAAARSRSDDGEDAKRSA
jgi:dolichol-phosphate mannosyltransferase